MPPKKPRRQVRRRVIHRRPVATMLPEVMMQAPVMPALTMRLAEMMPMPQVMRPLPMRAPNPLTMQMTISSRRSRATNSRH